MRGTKQNLLQKQRQNFSTNNKTIDTWVCCACFYSSVAHQLFEFAAIWCRPKYLTPSFVICYPLITHLIIKLFNEWINQKGPNWRQWPSIFFSFQIIIFIFYLSFFAKTKQLQTNWAADDILYFINLWIVIFIKIKQT